MYYYSAVTMSTLQIPCLGFNLIHFHSCFPFISLSISFQSRGIVHSVFIVNFLKIILKDGLSPIPPPRTKTAVVQGWNSATSENRHYQAAQTSASEDNWSKFFLSFLKRKHWQPKKKLK